MINVTERLRTDLRGELSAVEEALRQSGTRIAARQREYRTARENGKETRALIEDRIALIHEYELIHRAQRRIIEQLRALELGDDS